MLYKSLHCCQTYALSIQKILDIRKILNSGSEKVVINSYAFENPDFIRQASNEYGCSTIVISLDVKNTFWGS